MEEKDTKENNLENQNEQISEKLHETNIEANVETENNEKAAEETKIENTKDEKTQNQSKPKKQKSVVSKTFGILGKCVAWLIIVLLIVILVRALVYKKYDVFGYRFYLIMSGSMEPTIDVSDAVITKEMDTYQDNDIIAFEYQGATTVHRIIKTYTENGEKSYQTKGDNNNAADKGLIKKSQIKGKVMYRVPKVGDAIIFLQRNIIIILILIFGGFIIISLIRRLI